MSNDPVKRFHRTLKKIKWEQFKWRYFRRLDSVMAYLAGMLVAFGLILNWDGSIGEAQNFIQAGIVLAILSCWKRL